MFRRFFGILIRNKNPWLATYKHAHRHTGALVFTDLNVFGSGVCISNDLSKACVLSLHDAMLNDRLSHTYVATPNNRLVKWTLL